MIFDIAKELRDFTYITSIYKYISNYNLRGHRIGRKIGDMIEILTIGAIYRNPKLKNRLQAEKKLEGYTPVGHKVEFSFSNNEDLFGTIECKCIGVEETTDVKETSCLRKLNVGSKFDIEFSNRWLNSNISMTIKLKAISSNSISISILALKSSFDSRGGFEF